MVNEITPKAEYIWVSVAGGECEPAVRKDGNVFTLGCPDPMPPDRFRELGRISGQPPRPKTPDEQAAFERWLEEERKAGRRHGYMRF